MNTAQIILAGLVLVALLVWRSRRTPLMPESLVRVTISETGIVVVYPQGIQSHVSWSAVTKVCIRTTDAGPLNPDVFWQVYDGASTPTLVIPNGATGEQDLLGAIPAYLPGASAEAVIEAMGSTSNRTFLIWQSANQPRPGGPA